MNSRLRWTFAITSLALFAFTLDRLVVAIALPAIRTDLGAPVSGLEWTVNAYTLSFAVLLLTGGGGRGGRTGTGLHRARRLRVARGLHRRLRAGDVARRGGGRGRGAGRGRAAARPRPAPYRTADPMRQ
jgi:hypothetical protein